MSKTLSEWVHLCHHNSSEAGWWSEGKGPYIIGTKIALLHSEVSELLEAYRKGSRDSHIPDRPGVDVEFADIFIRLCDLAGALEVDLEGSVVDKLTYNKVRYDHSLEARSSSGGKTF